MPENPYEWSNEKLVKNFMNACADAGTAGSGLVIDVFANFKIGYAHYLRGVLLARLDGETCPFKPGDKVRAESGGGSIRTNFDYYGSSLNDGEEQTVARIKYNGNKRWLLSFVGIKDNENNASFYPAEKFVPVS